MTDPLFDSIPDDGRPDPPAPCDDGLGCPRGCFWGLLGMFIVLLLAAIAWFIKNWLGIRL